MKPIVYPVEILVTDDLALAKNSKEDSWWLYQLCGDPPTREGGPILELDARLTEEAAVSQACRLHGCALAGLEAEE